jgi:hydrogenase maturation factor
MITNLTACDATSGCITCGDVAIALTVFELRGTDAWCSDAAARDPERRHELVAIELIPDVEVGDRLLVHAGVALERLDPDGGDA